MSSRPETIRALNSFYKEVTRQPYLDDSALKSPPAAGWDTIGIDRLRRLGKTDGAIDLLRYLPYLEATGEYERLLVWADTTPIAYTREPSFMMEEVNPLPGRCVYLTEGVDGGGYSLILDTDKGNITFYSVAGCEIEQGKQAAYDSIPRSEQWQAHRTLPAALALAHWTQQYARLITMLVPNLIRAPTTGTFYARAITQEQREQTAAGFGASDHWQPNIEEAVGHTHDESMRQHRTYREQHIADLYNCILRHGWPNGFDKVACRTEVLQFEKEAAAERRRFLDANNPDAYLFDD